MVSKGFQPKIKDKIVASEVEIKNTQM